MVLANCHRDPKRRAYTVEDFMPKKGKPVTTEQTAEQQFEIVKLWQAQYEARK